MHPFLCSPDAKTCPLASPARCSPLLQCLCMMCGGSTRPPPPGHTSSDVILFEFRDAQDTWLGLGKDQWHLVSNKLDFRFPGWKWCACVWPSLKPNLHPSWHFLALERMSCCIICTIRLSPSVHSERGILFWRWLPQTRCFFIVSTSFLSSLRWILGLKPMKFKVFASLGRSFDLQL